MDSVDSTKPSDEVQYLDAIRRIMAEGDRRTGRNGETLSLPGLQMTYDLSGMTLPIFTSKRVFWRGVKEELLWFLRGDTSGTRLAEKGVHIWDGNGTREFLDSRGLYDNPEGDLGPIYGFQWRHWGATYRGCNEDYSGQGIDQIQRLIDTIRTNPYDRRLLVSAWNVGELDKMALPPCHMFMQFHVTSKKELTCIMHQRSADMGLGVPFNVASYSLLTHMIAFATGLKAKQFIHNIGDAHIYVEHLDALRAQLERPCLPFPTLEIRRPHEIKEIDDYTSDDLHLVGYKAGPTIPMKFVV